VDTEQRGFFSSLHCRPAIETMAILARNEAEAKVKAEKLKKKYKALSAVRL